MVSGIKNLIFKSFKIKKKTLGMYMIVYIQCKKEENENTFFSLSK